MNAQKAIAKFQKAGATVTTIRLTGATVRHIATFPNGKICTFQPDWETDEVDAFAIPLFYDEANQSTVCSWYYTAKSAIESVTR